MVLAFRAINPKAPTHVLIVPRKPIPNLTAAKPEDAETLGHLMLKAAAGAKQLGFEHSGCRLVFNVGPDAGESAPHLHRPILGGRQLGWPPG